MRKAIGLRKLGSLRNAISLMVALLLAAPIVSRADKKDDALAEIQRDVADVGEQVKNLEKAQAAQAKDIQALQGMLQQAVSASTQTAQQMDALKTALTNLLNSSLADQQAKLTQSINTSVGSQLGSLSTSVDQLNTTFVQMSDRIGKVESKLNELKDTVTNLNTPPPAPPAPVLQDTGAATAPGPCAGFTALTLKQAAELDYTTNRDQMALDELNNYVKCYPQDAWAPTAGYSIGMIYLERAKDYESAVEAFDSVITKYPGNNQSQDAMYQKGRALVRWGNHKQEALNTLKDFVNMYPVNDNVKSANELIHQLSASGSNTKKGPARGSVAK